MARAAVVPVYFDAGRSRVFACAIDWPGWCRRAKTEEDALDALVEYAPRYAAVADRAGIRFAFDPSPVFDVVERLPAPAGTSFSAADFGALGDPCQRDHAPTSVAEAKRLAALVEAAWGVLDDVVAAAPEQLRKGPRGGGSTAMPSTRTCSRPRPPTSASSAFGTRNLTATTLTPSRRCVPRHCRLCGVPGPPIPLWATAGRLGTPRGALPGTSSTMRGRSRTRASD